MLQSLLNHHFIAYFAAPKGIVPGLANWRRGRTGRLRIA